MKTSILPLAALIAFFFAPQTNLSAQKIATWKGGQPGHRLVQIAVCPSRPTEWTCAKNWLENRVPNEFSAVIIPDCSTTTFSNPILKKGEVEIYSLEIHSGAKLSIGKNARLIAIEQPGNELTAFTEGTVLPGAEPQTLLFANNQK